MLSVLLASLITWGPAPIQNNQDPTAIYNVAALIKGGTDGENMLGDVGDARVHQQYNESADSALRTKVQNAFDRLMNVPGARRDGLRYHVTILASSEINAFALPGGRLYVFDTLARVMTADELLFVLGHELGHANRGHGVAKMRDNLLIGAGLSLLTKSSKGPGLIDVLAALSNFASAKHSRDQENQADSDGFSYALSAGANPMAPLAATRRLATLETQQPGLLASLFASHPPTAARSTKLRQLAIDSEYGAPFTTLVASDKLKLGTVKIYDASSDPNSAWVHDYTTMTGQPVYHLSNYFALGECTWCAQALRGEIVPRGPAGTNNAVNWPEHCQKAGYGFGSVPKLFAIACWNNKVGGGVGHVATVAAVYPNGWVGVWDANWSKDLDHKIRYRIIDPTAEKNLTGFIYWPNGQIELPGSTTITPPRGSINLLSGPTYLGDGHNAGLPPNTDWHTQLALTSAELGQASRFHLELELKAVPRKDPIISINGHEVWRLVAESNDWRRYQSPSLATKILGSQNFVDAETIVVDARAGFDECWLRNVTLVFDH